MNKVSVNNWLAHGKKQWVVSSLVGGRRVRGFFSSKAAADAEAVFRRSQMSQTGESWLSIPAAARHRMIDAYRAAEAAGLDLLKLVEEAKAGPRRQESPTLEVLLDEITTVKEAAGRSDRYIQQLRLAIGKFSTGREQMQVGEVSFREVDGFLGQVKNHGNRKTLRSRLSTMFGFAVRRGYRLDNPCDRLESVTVPFVTPATFTLDEVRECLQWLKVHPRSFAWFVLSTFAGLRPEEAEQTGWSAISFKEGWVRVEAQTSKMRQRRVVYPPSQAIALLKLSKSLGAILPIPGWARRSDRRALSHVLGWKEWKHDVTRHTCASMWLATSGSAATVATALGHSEAMLKRHYMALVTKEQAAEFWGFGTLGTAFSKSRAKRVPTTQPQ